MGGSAVISECGTYRYRLERKLKDSGPVVAFIMVNPSTADASQDDATIRKCVGFAKGLDARQLIVGNLFAYRSKEVEDLKHHPHPIGSENNTHLASIIDEADFVIAAWGASSKVPAALRDRWKTLVKIVDARAKTILCLGELNDGHPRHPLMASYNSDLKTWNVPWFAGRALREEAK